MSGFFQGYNAGIASDNQTRLANATAGYHDAAAAELNQKVAMQQYQLQRSKDIAAEFARQISGGTTSPAPAAPVGNAPMPTGPQSGGMPDGSVSTFAAPPSGPLPSTPLPPSSGAGVAQPVGAAAMPMGAPAAAAMSIPDQMRLLGKISMQHGDLAGGLSSVKDAADMEHKADTAHLQNMEAASKHLGLIAGLMGTVKDQASLDNARMTANAMGIPTDGVPTVWTPETQQMIQQQSQATLQAKDKLDLALRQQQVNVSQQRADDMASYHKARIQQFDSSNAIARDRLADEQTRTSAYVDNVNSQIDTRKTKAAMTKALPAPTPNDIEAVSALAKNDPAMAPMFANVDGKGKPIGFPGYDRFIYSVASRAKQLAAGSGMDAATAQQQALQELKPNVAGSSVKTGVPGISLFDKTTNNYTFKEPAAARPTTPADLNRPGAKIKVDIPSVGNPDFDATRQAAMIKIAKNPANRAAILARLSAAKIPTDGL